MWPLCKTRMFISKIRGTANTICPYLCTPDCPQLNLFFLLFRKWTNSNFIRKTTEQHVSEIPKFHQEVPRVALKGKDPYQNSFCLDAEHPTWSHPWLWECTSLNKYFQSMNMKPELSPWSPPLAKPQGYLYLLSFPGSKCVDDVISSYLWHI